MTGDSSGDRRQGAGVGGVAGAVIEETFPKGFNMGYVFSGDNQREFRMSRVAWPAVTKIACAHGWEPMGTVHNRIEELEGNPQVWGGSYFGNCGQEVLPEDAGALGRAIRTALKDESYKFSDDPCDECVALFQNLIGRELLAQFAEFCMSTGFCIS